MSLHPKKVLVIKDGLARPSSWVTSFFLPHDSLRVGERGFGQVVTQLYQLTAAIYQYVIGMFNTYSWGPTRRLLNNTGNGYNLGGAGFPHHTPRPSQPTVLHFPPKDPTRSQVNHSTLATGLKEDQTINLTSDTIYLTSIVSYYLCIACANDNPPR
jgi:hypothetical protein